MRRKRPNCPYCGEPCALPEDFDGIDRGIRDPWCENDECEFVGEPVRPPERED